MNYKITSINEDIVKEITTWKYDGQYSVYNTESFEDLKARNANIINPTKSNNYMCYFNDEDKLIAYTNITKKDNEVIFLGIGLAPEFCNKGLGKEILKHSIEEIKIRYSEGKIALQVRSWNIRAIKCYEKVGFKKIKCEVIEDHNGKNEEFVFMEYNLN